MKTRNPTRDWLAYRAIQVRLSTLPAWSEEFMAEWERNERIKNRWSGLTPPAPSEIIAHENGTPPATYGGMNENIEQLRATMTADEWAEWVADARAEIAATGEGAL